ncbi:MAG: LysM peptidoglycan-binding domain-containing protein [Cypionkella sp.]|nr:LysM peptidoglycan-binding domain-containing protein [Cypionkella sp.]
MGGLLGQAARLALGAGVAVAAAVGVWLYTNEPPATGAAPAPPPAPEVALPPPAATPAPAAEPAPVAAEPAPQPAITRLAPSLDVVRVQSDGNATVAGLAEAGARVSLRVDGAEAAFATADGAGNFAALFTLPPSDAPRVLTVLSKALDGHEMAGTDSVILAPTTGALAAPTIKIDEGTAAAVLMDAPDIENITIDTIIYEGEIIRVAGRGAAGAAVRLYLDNADVATATIGAGGEYSADLTGIAAGTYTLRADQLDSEGNVTSRYEVPITKAAPQALAEAAPAPTVVQVAAGTTLWAIAKAQFGDGLMYIQVYEANKDKIRDPNLIYPGQVFEIPKQP